MPRRIPARIRKLMKELKEGLALIYGDKLKAVYLYGSYARGDYRDGSDVDVMILLKTYKNYSPKLWMPSKLLKGWVLDMDKPEFAAGRAYYAMFYIAEALLYEKGLEFHTHGQVIGAYGKYFAKTKELDPKFHRSLRAGFDARIFGDYDVDSNITNQLVADMINQAREFLEAAQKYLK